MIREGDEAAAQEDEMVGKEPEVERKREPQPEFEKQKEKKEENQKDLKEKEMINSVAYKEREREIQKHEEVKCLNREAADAEMKRVEE